MYRYTAPLSKWRRRTWYIIIWKPRHGSCRCCVGNPLRPQGRVIYWAPTLQPSLHLLAEDLLADPYSLMIITDHLPKWLINKAEAKQIIYLYGSVDIKFRVNGLKRIRGLGCQVMDGCTRLLWKYDPFNKFARSCSLRLPCSSLCIPLAGFVFFFHQSKLPSQGLFGDEVQACVKNDFKQL